MNATVAPFDCATLGQLLSVDAFGNEFYNSFVCHPQPIIPSMWNASALSCIALADTQAGPFSCVFLDSLQAPSRTPANLTFFTISLTIADYVMTLQDEIDLVWNRRWSPVTFVFFAVSLDASQFRVVDPHEIRYISLVGLIASTGSIFPCSGPEAPQWCTTHLMTARFVVTMIVFLNVQVILLLRLYAMFDKNKWLALINAVLFVGCAVLVALPVTFISDCFFPGAAFEGWLASLAIFKAVQSRQDLSRLNLLVVLIQDSLMYFVIIEAALVANLFLELENLSSDLVQMVLFVCGSRLVLHLRRVGSRAEHLPSHLVPSVLLSVQGVRNALERDISELGGADDGHEAPDNGGEDMDGIVSHDGATASRTLDSRQLSPRAGLYGVDWRNRQPATYHLSNPG